MTAALAGDTSQLRMVQTAAHKAGCLAAGRLHTKGLAPVATAGSRLSVKGAWSQGLGPYWAVPSLFWPGAWLEPAAQAGTQGLSPHSTRCPRNVGAGASAQRPPAQALSHRAATLSLPGNQTSGSLVCIPLQGHQPVFSPQGAAVAVRPHHAAPRGQAADREGPAVHPQRSLHRGPCIPRPGVVPKNSLVCAL